MKVCDTLRSWKTEMSSSQCSNWRCHVLSDGDAGAHGERKKKPRPVARCFTFCSFFVLWGHSLAPRDSELSPGRISATVLLVVKHVVCSPTSGLIKPIQRQVTENNLSFWHHAGWVAKSGSAFWLSAGSTKHLSPKPPVAHHTPPIPPTGYGLGRATRDHSLRFSGWHEKALLWNVHNGVRR